MHIGSFPGVFGSSGTHVKAPRPCRNVRNWPSLPTAMMVASLETATGAADIALAINSASAFGF
jgi:hypothetical protein